MYNGGYTGKILRINLTEQQSKIEDLSTEMAKDFIGGAGLGIKYLFDEIKAGTDPLSPENKLFFVVGPLTGTSIPCTSRMAVVSKSPLTGAVGMSLTGGYFPAELKFAGYDMLIIEGAAEKPTFISIKDNEIRFRNASEIWGTQTTDCLEIIKDKIGDQNACVARIGPAGENLSRISCIMNERRAAGRKGLGAVMGSKNLKAIAISGSKSLTIANDTDFKSAKNEMAKLMKESPVLYSQFSKFGTPMVVDLTCELGIFPAKNWSETGLFLPTKEIGLEAQEQLKLRSNHCFGCPVGCSQVKLAKNLPYAGTVGEPEFETLYSFGGQTGVDNPDSIVTADRLCDELGLDTISAGVTIGFAMELFEKGIIGLEETKGLNLKFGNHEDMIQLLKAMAYRQGIGSILADGVKKTTQELGKQTELYAIHIKGLELPGYDVRGALAHGLNYATAYTGADHNRGYAFQEIFGIPIPWEADRFSPEKKGELTVWNQDIRTATCDCPTICAFMLDMALAGNATEITATLLNAVTGLGFNAQDIANVGERVNNLARSFNVREGFSRTDDILPERLMNEHIRNGNSKGCIFNKETLDKMLDEYYSARGWDIESGTPTREKLSSLNLEYVSDHLKI